MGSEAGQASCWQSKDAMAYLPRKPVTHVARGQVIYDESHPFAGLYLVLQGRVKVCLAAGDGSDVIFGLHSPDDCFGERALLSKEVRGERAVALDNASLMFWTVAEVEGQIQRQPKLGIALIQMLVARCRDSKERLESLALDPTPERLALSLVQLVRRHGKRAEDGAICIPPLTHQFLSEYIGTSREAVSFQMSQLRREGLVQYSRQGMSVYAEALLKHIGKS